MKRLFTTLWVVVFVLALCGAAIAQGAAPADGSTGTTHFSVSGSAVGFSGAGSASAATIAGGSVALTNRVALGYEQVIAPSVSATYYLGTVNYTMPIKALLGKSISSGLVFDTSKWSTTFFAGAGVMRQDLTGTMQQHVATTVGTGLNYTADSHITIQLISAQWLHGAVAGPGANLFVVTPNTAAISSGLKLTF
jgi:hypothetical protein